MPVYTDAANAVFILTGRRTEPLPGRLEHLSGRPNRAYPAELGAVSEAVERRRDGLVVLFLPLRDRHAVIAAMDALQRRMRLTGVAGDEVAVAYRAQPSRSERSAAWSAPR